jgi:hypothetical protein
VPNKPYLTRNLVTGVATSTPGELVIESSSAMWDEKDGGRRFKPCTHCSTFVEPYLWDHYDYSDTTNLPNPKTRYEGRFRVPGGIPSLPTTMVGTESFIPVTGNSADDLGKCVFDAYNKFVNGLTALNASVSIAELRETPALFSIWQRRLSAPRNIVNGFLNYSFGWKPVYSDLVAIQRELRTFPATVRKRLKAIGDGEVVRHYKFRLDNTVDDLNTVFTNGRELPAYAWSFAYRDRKTVDKSRVVVVTIRANVKPKLGPEGQATLDKLGALGLIPSLSTLWSLTRLTFVTDWFYNIGGAIENLQGCLTHDVSNVRVGISDLRRRTLRYGAEDGKVTATVQQTYYKRMPTSVPILPVLSYPRRVMPYVLLGALGLSTTKLGGKILDKGPKLNVDLNINALRARLLRDPDFRKKVFGSRG